MSSEPNPAHSWRPTVTHLVPQEPTGPRWRRESQAGDSRWPRRLGVAGLFGGFLACTGLLVWASFWLFPPKPAGLILVGAGYETNLAVPHNVAGREGMQELAAWSRSQPAEFWWRSGLLKLKPEPIELQKNAAWDTALTRADEKTVVLYFAMHGASDAKGPYLIRQDADGSDPERDRLRVTEILERLKKLPAGKNKVVIFDATQVPAYWSLGVLHNDFARALEQLDGEIDKIPNLVVLSASAPDQRSWASDELKRTLYSYYVLEGLKGAADANEDGRVDALELHTYISTAVERWVRANRQAVQTPVLLPSKSGPDRAGNILLTMVPRPYQAADPAPTSGWTPPAELTKAWDNAARLAALTPPPEVYSPAVWQQYRATLLRYEQLLRAGDNDHAKEMADQLPALELLIEHAKNVPLDSASNTLTMAKLAGAAPLSIDDSKIFETLWGAGDDDRASEWTKQQAKLPKDLETRQALRLKLLERIIRRAQENPRDNLLKAMQLTALLNDAAVPRPAESHWLLMLVRRLPQDPRLLSTDFANLVTLALKVRLQAEQAALGLPSSGHPYSERVRPWIESQIREADEHRALGQDLLFIRETARWDTAREELRKAEKLYSDAQVRAQDVVTTYAVRDRLFADLPGFTRLVAALRVSDALSNERIDGQRKQLEQLWHDVHALADALDGPTDLPPDAVTKMSQDAVNTQKRFAALVEQEQGRLSNASERNGLTDWYDIEAALWYPSWPAQLRTRALANQRTIEQAYLRKTEINAGKTVLPAPEAQKKQLLDEAERQGRLAQAQLGENAFEQEKGSTLETFKDVTYRLDNFRKNEHSWWESLAIAGEDIGLRWQALTNRANSLTTGSRQADLKNARAQLQHADRLAHQLDGTSNARFSAKPAEQYRRLLLHDFLLWQAGRTLDEHWFAENDGEPNSKPYYQEAGRRYADDAQRMVTSVQIEEATAMLARLKKPDRLVLKNPPPQVLTSERAVQVAAQIEPPAGAKFRPGYAVLRVDSSPQLNAVFNGDGAQWVAELKPQAPSVAVPLRITQNVSAVPPSSYQEMARVNAHGFFRGQILEEGTPVELHPLASKVYYEYPLPVTRAVAVRTTPDLQSFGDGTGSLAIVLDCSGSMGSDPKNPKDKTKWDEALQALADVLKPLPRGTTVSVWVFGQAVGPLKTVEKAEDTIIRLLEPTAWNPEDPEQRHALMKTIEKFEPWNESPIVEAILKAKGDLAGAKGNKSIVVLTDGYDNRFGKDKKPAKSIETTLREAFQDSGIVVNIVGFKFGSREEEDIARRQFKVLETLTPPGRFFATQEAGNLAAQLREAMRQRLQFWIDREDHERLAEIPDTGLELSSGSGNDRWYRFPESLPPGGYKLRVDTNRRVLKNILVNRGDLLLLNLVPGADGVEFRRAFVTRDDYGDKPGESSGDWRLAALQNQRINDRGLEMLLMLDRAPEKIETTLQQMRPRETWLEVDSSAGPSATFSMRWGYQPGYPAPAWDVKSSQWPAMRGTQTPAKPVVRMWWSPVLDTPPDTYIERPVDSTLLNRTNVSLPLENDTVVVDHIAVETQKVETQPGKLEDKRCLVVRVTHPLAKPVKVRIEGIAPAGQEHHYYPEAGKYTALFWPVTEAQVNSSLSRINLISINRFKNTAEDRRNRHYILLDKLNEPLSTDVRPQPPIEMKYE